MRFRHRYSCGHSSAITDQPAPARAHCERCATDVTITSTKRLSDDAKMPTETRAARDRQARAVARDRPQDVAARHFKL